MTRRAIEKALPYWKSLLKLGDWTITVRQGSKAEMDGGEAVGLNFIHPEEMLSLILLRRGATEEDLVHEILHLVTDGDRAQDGTYDVLHERAINRVAGALIELKKQKEPTQK